MCKNWVCKIVIGCKCTANKQQAHLDLLEHQIHRRKRSHSAYMRTALKHYQPVKSQSTLQPAALHGDSHTTASEFKQLDHFQTQDRIDVTRMLAVARRTCHAWSCSSGSVAQTSLWPCGCAFVHANCCMRRYYLSVKVYCTTTAVVADCTLWVILGLCASIAPYRLALQH